MGATEILLATIVAALLVALLRFLALFRSWCIEDDDRWAIGVYRWQQQPLQFAPHPAIGDRPVITAADCSDVDAQFVADPFVVQREGRWHLFFEVMERKRWRGCIAHASSDDGISWRYDRVVLRDRVHLSFPCVVAEGDEMFMLPECARSGELRLFRATRFPQDWDYDSTLMGGAWYDPSVVQHAGRWWLFARDAARSLRLFHAASLRGPWAEHPASPIVRECGRSTRPGGRILVTPEGLVRFAQDGTDGYGMRVWAFRITQLTTEAYAEVELPGPVLQGRGSGWNATGMHHVDAQRSASGEPLALVDGFERRRVFNWRAGARRLQTELFRLIGRGAARRTRGSLDKAPPVA